MGISDTPKHPAHADLSGIASSSLLRSNLWNRKVINMAGLKILRLLKVSWFNPHSQLVHILESFGI